MNKIFNSKQFAYILVSVCLDGGLRFYWLSYLLFALSAGINNVTITSLQAIFLSLANVVLEVPTGFFGDKYGRKKSVLLGFACYTLAFPIFVFFPNIYGISAMFLLMSFGGSFVSGSLESILVDGISDKEKIENLIASSNIWLGVFGIILRILAGFLAFWIGFSNNLLTASGFFALALLLSIRFLPKDTHNQKEQFDYRLTFRQFFGNKQILTLGIISSLWFVFLASYFTFINVILANKVGQFVGVANSLISTAEVIAGYLMLRLVFFKKLKLQYLFFVQSISLFFCYRFLDGGFILPALAAILLFETSAEIYTINIFSSLNKVFANQNRASLNSMKSMFDRFGESIGLVIAGGIADKTSNLDSLIFGVIGLAVLGFIVIFLGRKQSLV